jgi:hypothetical protein
MVWYRQASPQTPTSRAAARARSLAFSDGILFLSPVPLDPAGRDPADPDHEDPSRPHQYPSQQHQYHEDPSQPHQYPSQSLQYPGPPHEYHEDLSLPHQYPSPGAQYPSSPIPPSPRYPSRLDPTDPGRLGPIRPSHFDPAPLGQFPSWQPAPVLPARARPGLQRTAVAGRLPPSPREAAGPAAWRRGAGTAPPAPPAPRVIRFSATPPPLAHPAAGAPHFRTPAAATTTFLPPATAGSAAQLPSPAAPPPAAAAGGRDGPAPDVGSPAASRRARYECLVFETLEQDWSTGWCAPPPNGPPPNGPPPDGPPRPAAAARGVVGQGVPVAGGNFGAAAAAEDPASGRAPPALLWPRRLSPLPLPVLRGRSRSAARISSAGPGSGEPADRPTRTPVTTVSAVLVFKFASGPASLLAPAAVPVRAEDRPDAGGKVKEQAEAEAAAAAAAVGGRGAGFRRFVAGAVARLDPERAEDAVEALQAALPMPVQVSASRVPARRMRPHATTATHTQRATRTRARANTANPRSYRVARGRNQRALTARAAGAAQVLLAPAFEALYLVLHLRAAAAAELGPSKAAPARPAAAGGWRLEHSLGAVMVASGAAAVGILVAMALSPDCGCAACPA